MADINLSTTNTKYIDYTIINRNFMANMTKFKKEQQSIDFNQLRHTVELLQRKLKSLASTELEEWIEIHELKIKEIYENYKSKGNLDKSRKLQQYANSLRQSLHILIGVTQQCHHYNSNMIADIIQAFYYQEYQENVLKAMEDAGYKTSKYKTLHYEQPSFFNLCCCWAQ